MKTVFRIILAALLGMVPVLFLHFVLTTRDYVRARSNPVICISEATRVRGSRVLDEVLRYPCGDPFAPDLTTTPPDERARFIVMPDVMKHLDFDGYYWLYARHWHGRSERLYPRMASFTDRLIFVEEGGVSSSRWASAVILGQGKLPVASLNLGGNYLGWLQNDIRWIGSGGWVIYVVAGMVGVGLRYRRMLKRGTTVLHRTGSASLASAATALARFDEKIEQLNSGDVDHDAKRGVQSTALKSK